MEEQTCKVSEAGLIIDNNGDIKICRNMDSIGNIKVDNIKEAWNSKKAQDVRDKIFKCSRSCKILTCNNSDSLVFFK
jgi:radical SAM protein with 4Fe4S-binding SPASM domain